MGEWREGYAAYIQLITFVDHVSTCPRQSINSVIELFLWTLTSNDVTINKKTIQVTIEFKSISQAQLSKMREHVFSIFLNVCLWLRAGQASTPSRIDCNVHGECTDVAHTLRVIIASIVSIDSKDGSEDSQIV